MAHAIYISQICEKIPLRHEADIFGAPWLPNGRNHMRRQRGHHLVLTLPCGFARYMISMRKPTRINLL